MDDNRADVGYKYCPQCRTEYRPGFEVCTDCGSYLVYELPPEEGPGDVAPPPDERGLGPNPVAVFSAGRDTDAEIVRGVLEGCGIVAEVWASGMDAYTGRGAIGRYTGVAVADGYRVMVRPDDAELAREIIAAEPQPEEG